MNDENRPNPPADHPHHGHQHHHPPVSRRPHHPRQEEDDPIARYVEWTEHRYTPGYYLGGRMPPTIRALQGGGRAGRMLGSLLIVLGLLDLLFVAALACMGKMGNESAGLIVSGVLSLMVGVAAFRRQR